MKRQAYLDLKERQQKEFNEFPIAYAFSEKQLEEALAKLDATKEECVTLYGYGDILKKTDIKPFKNMMIRHMNELKEAMKDTAFAEAAFLYEMDNHEYAINWSGDEDVLSCFAMDAKELVELGLDGAYRRARSEHMRHAEEWGVI